MKKLSFILLISVLFWNCKQEAEPIPTVSIPDSTFERPYKITILNEHDVLCIFGTDSVHLYFENAYVLHQETIVFIKK